jgi:NADH dehydrogenase [ubiquinone] 1 alpha subcomplex assembly factor 7
VADAARTCAGAARCVNAIVTLKDRMRGLIAQGGPMTVAQFMALALHDPLNGYYARRAAIGADGDFITAPEVSQMFGELVGLWCAQSWEEMGRPVPVHLIELGPGNGALMADILRAASVVPSFHNALRVMFVEASGPLRAMQQRQAPDAAWYGRIEDAPHGPSLIIGNEFLDCFPVRQFVRAPDGWRERVVGLVGEHLAFGLAPTPLADAAVIPQTLRDAPEGSVAEVAPALPVFVAHLAERLHAHPGRALFIDYGAPVSTAGDTLQAVRAHAKVDPLEAPGAADLTAHVDFGALSQRARDAGLKVAGPVGQGAWLAALGIETRAQTLGAARPDRAATIARQLNRLTHPEKMGVLFQAICLSSPDLPMPAGFSP